jgi:hypothetical protein
VISPVRARAAASISTGSRPSRRSWRSAGGCRGLLLGVLGDHAGRTPTGRRDRPYSSASRRRRRRALVARGPRPAARLAAEFDDPIGMEARIGEVADEDPAGEVAGEVGGAEEDQLPAAARARLHSRLAARLEGGAGPRGCRHGRRHGVPDLPSRRDSCRKRRGATIRAMLYGRGAERSRIAELLEGARQSRTR